MSRRSIAGYGDILIVEPAASSNYNALQLQAERQRATGLSFRAAYTWGKSIDDTSAFLPSSGNDNTPQDARHPEAERGLSDFDVRHRVSVAVVWPIPPARWTWTEHWQVSAIFAAQSGRPFTPRVSVDNSNTGNNGGSFGYDRPNEVTPGTAGAVFYEGRAFVMAPPYIVRRCGAEHPDWPRLGESRPGDRADVPPGRLSGASNCAPRSTTRSTAPILDCRRASSTGRPSVRASRRMRRARSRSSHGSISRSGEVRS